MTDTNIGALTPDRTCPLRIISDVIADRATQRFVDVTCTYTFGRIKLCCVNIEAMHLNSGHSMNAQDSAADNVSDSVRIRSSAPEDHANLTGFIRRVERFATPLPTDLKTQVSGARIGSTL
jgi:hypothetical protein